MDLFNSSLHYEWVLCILNKNKKKYLSLKLEKIFILSSPPPQKKSIKDHLMSWHVGSIEQNVTKWWPQFCPQQCLNSLLRLWKDHIVPYSWVSPMFFPPCAHILSFICLIFLQREHTVHHPWTSPPNSTYLEPWGWRQYNAKDMILCEQEGSKHLVPGAPYQDLHPGIDFPLHKDA